MKKNFYTIGNQVLEIFLIFSDGISRTSFKPRLFSGYHQYCTFSQIVLLSVLICEICGGFLFSFSQNNKVDSLLQVLKTAKDDSGKVMALNACSWQMINAGDYAQAKQYANSALALSGKINYKKGEAEALNNIGIIYDDQGNYPEALKNHFTALKIREEMLKLLIENSVNSSDELRICKKSIAASYNNIGIIYSEQDNHDEALKYFFEALKLKEEIGDKNGIALLYNNIGVIYKAQGNSEEALKNYLTALKIKEELKDKWGIAGCYNNIGIIYDSRAKQAQNPDSAEIYYSKALKNHFDALKIEKEINDKNGLATSYINISAIYVGQNRKNGNKQKLKDAKKYLEEALMLSKEIGSIDVMKECYNNLAEASELMGDFKNAYDYHKLFILCRDSLINEENSNKILRSQMTYEFEKKEATTKVNHEKQIAIATEKNKKQKIILWFVISGMLLVAVVAVIIFRSLRITKNQKEIIEKQKIVVDEKNKNIEFKSKEITDSINYAKRIQRSFLTPSEEFESSFGEHFILYRPKNIVSGDFYWLVNIHTTPKNGETKKLSVLSLVDCTGHGVPGALMSIVGNTLLNQTIKNPDINSPADVLGYLNRELPKNIRKHDKNDLVRDGMDMVMCAFDFTSSKMFFSGANNPIYFIRNNQLKEQRGDKQPISASDDIPKKNFTNHTFDLLKGDTVYLFTDGFADQFGGPKGKKFKYKQLADLLVSIQEKSMDEQKEVLNKTFDNWKGSLEQVDDVCIIGVKI